MKENNITLMGIIEALYDAGKLESLRELFNTLGAESAAEILSLLPDARKVAIFRAMPKDLAVDTFAIMDAAERDSLIHSFTEPELRQIISASFDALVDDATEDIEIMGGITPSEQPYLNTPIWKIWWSRIPWLLILMVSATFTGMIITHFESALSAYVVLTAYIPMLMDTGGNSGSQSSVTVIRSLSLNELKLSDVFRVLWIESRVAVLCGLTLAVVNFAKLMLLDRVGLEVSLTVCATLVCTVFAAKIVGCTLPLLAKRVGLDPAVCASPFLTTVVDAVSLLIYFRIATAMLGI